MNADAMSRAGNWIIGSDRGESSTTIWAFMMGARLPRWREHPCDAHDLGRCLRLLNLIPEWKPRIGEMAEVSVAWARLVENWDQLASCMEQEVGIDWSKGRVASRTDKLIHQIVLGKSTEAA